MNKYYDGKKFLRHTRLWVGVGLALVLIVAATIGYFWGRRTTEDTSQNECVSAVQMLHFQLELADSPSERIQGLSGRPSMPADCGLLFTFDSAEPHGIVMKDMKFPIDILWLDHEKRVISIRENARPESYPEVFYPHMPAMFVIELNAGEAKAAGIRPGQQLEF